ncbi:MAG TPA: uroporphyrinogen-III synthase, partial [Puia sp.]|nr:uroporphyrinogen-III synthase [Puia sp.]
MSDNRIHVLSTSALPDLMVAEAATNGIRIDHLSFIGTEIVENKQIEGLLDRPLTAVFTSRKAVQAMGEKGGRDWDIYCVGQAAADRYGTTAIAGSAESAKELAEKIIRTCDRREVYFFCGDRRRDELPEMLRKEEFIVHEVTVYRTISTPHRLTRNYDGIAFFSPSAVDSFFSVNSLTPEIP